MTAPPDPTADGAPPPPRHASTAATLAATLTPGRGTPSFDEDHRARSSPEGGDLPRGTLIGRYVILTRIGSGAMGVVYGAYDPDLDRKIALKLLHPGKSGGLDTTEGHRRLLREAQAMAKLAHPNVVTVHDVGEHQGRVYVAMEFIEGTTLARWMQHEHTWRETLNIFVRAGRGLAAAHAEGLVHRDFKPDNVMIGADGRVRVMDFGLARSSGPTAVAGPSTAGGSPSPHRDAPDAELTRAGAILGTPAYMAPEQWLGQDVGPAADQFAWCVSLWQALYGERPFSGETPAQIAFAVGRGKIRSPPAGRGVPRWLQRILTRGLATEPGDRYPSMESLLATLRRGQARARWTKTAAALGALLLVGMTAEGVRRHRRAQAVDSCLEQGASIRELWNDDSRNTVRRGLLATGVPYAEQTVEHTIPWLDRYAQAWEEARAQTCLAAEVRHELNQDIHDRATWCLTSRRHTFGALIEQLSEADAAVAQEAVSAAAELNPVGPCVDPDLLARSPAPPRDRAAFGQVQDLLSRAWTLERAGDYNKGLDAARDALARAKELGWAPLVAAARLHEGVLLDDLGQYEAAEQILTEDYFLAADAGALATAAEAARNLLYTIGYNEARPREGRLWGRHAQVMLTRLGVGEHSLRRATLLSDLAGVAQASGDNARARTLGWQALRIREDILGPGHPAVGRTLNNLAGYAREAARYEEARELGERATAILEDALGPNHPDVAQSLVNLAVIYRALDEPQRSLDLYTRAIPILEGAYGPEHPIVAQALNNLAVLHKREGRYPEAIALYGRALAILERALGPEHPHVAKVLNNLAIIHERLGGMETAKTLHQRALDIRRSAFGPEHAAVGESLMNLGGVLLHAGDPAAATDLLQQAVAILTKTRGPEHTATANAHLKLGDAYAMGGRNDAAAAEYRTALAILEAVTGSDHSLLSGPLVALAELALERGHPAEALPLARRALKLREGGRTSPDDLAEARFLLARVLYALPPSEGRDRRDALARARQALRDLHASSQPDDIRREISAWIASHTAAQ